MQPTTSYTPADATAAINGIYQSEMGRAPTAGELSNGINAITTGEYNPDQYRTNVHNDPMAIAFRDPSATNLSSAMSALTSSYQDPTTVYNNALNQLGVTDARTRVTNLQQALLNNESLLNNLPTNIGQRVQNSDVTQGQRSALIAEEGAPLQTTETNLNANYTGANSNLQNIMSQALQQANLYNTGFTTQQGALQQEITNAQDKEKEQFAEQQASQPSSSGGGGGTTAKPSVNTIINYWKTADTGQVGGGGAYNPNDHNYYRWQAAENDLAAQGYDPNQYKKLLAAAFGGAADKTQYGVTGY